MDSANVINIGTVGVILSTLLSPLIAVQVTRFLDRKKIRKDEQLKVFKTLMATRAAPLAPAHVEALNTIDVVFHGSTKGEKQIREEWKEYLDWLNQPNTETDLWNNTRTERIIDLLAAMASYLGFEFDRTELKNHGYFPKGHGEIELEQMAIRKGFTRVFLGETAFPIEIKGIHSDATKPTYPDDVQEPTPAASP